MRHQGYYNRALKAHDPRFARIFGRLGYETTALVADDNGPTIEELRETYKAVVGKRPFNGWDAETLASKIADARRAG